jgi:tRNA(Ile)-lysidine synthase
VSDEFPVPEGQDAPLLHAVQSAFLPDTPKRIGVAVSGGGDSMALLHLMHCAAAHAFWQVFAVTVDHGLRPEAADEANFVTDFCAKRGIPHDIVKWADWDGKGNLQDQARRARYRLIADWAKRSDISHIALGHTADDQAETFLMRLARSSGIDGLAAMRGRWAGDGLTWARPLLSASRHDLRAYLNRNDVPWIDDPTNEDTRFDRVKARQALAALKPMGITQDILADVARNLSSARTALVSITADFARQHCRQQGGDLVLARQPMIQLPFEIYRQLMTKALLWVTGADYAPRANMLQNLHHAIVAVGNSRTLAGCRITISNDQVRIAREYNAVRDLSCTTTEIWDGRWQLTGPHDRDLTIRALAAEGLKYCPDWRDTGLPRVSLIASPAVWQAEKLIAAPLAGLENGWQVDLAPARNNFARFVLSH